MSRTFSNGTYSVTVHDDRSIRVQAGDWISKYSAAIYGDPLVNWSRFKRRDAAGRYFNLADPNKITAGELLYHPDALPGEPRKPTYPIGTPNVPETPDPNEGVEPSRVLEFCQYLKQWLCPENDWRFVDSVGLDLSASIFTGHYCAIGAQRLRDPQPTWFHGVSAGVGIGPEDIAGSVSISPPDMFSAGFVGKFPTAGRSLSADEICGSYMVIDLSAGFLLGGSVSFLLFGMNGPVQFVLRNVVRYFRGTGDYLMPWVFNGAVVMAGLNWSSPNLGVGIKIGCMHRKECVTG